MTMAAIKASLTKKRRLLRFQVEVKPQDFMNLDSSHPYGVLPGGNRFLSEDSNVATNATHISPNDLLSDECLNHILGFCSGADLGRMVQTCRYFYVAGHQPEHWRDLVLRRQGGTAIATTGPSWKDTFVQLFHAEKYKPHEPMPVLGVYSDYHYRLHSCRSFAIPSSWCSVESGSVESGSVDRVPVEDMTTDKFLEEYEKQNKPVVIEGAALSWKAFEKWQDPDYCQQHTTGRSFRATSGAAALSADFTLPAYHNYCKSTHLEEAPLYLFDRTALEPGSHLWKDYMPDLQKSCPYWDVERQNETGHDLFEVLGQGRRPDHTWLIVGPQRSGSVFHIDPNATHAWNAVICGRKRWIFYPPGVAPPGVHPSRDGDEVALPISVGEWLFQFWDEHTKRKKTAPPGQVPLETTTMPGDVVFVPHGWWHLVVNLDELNIAITHNYVGISNLANVLRFLDTKRDQVSGCRDRTESVKPEQLHAEFKDTMMHLHPDWLEEASKEPDWTCNAWQSVSTVKGIKAKIPITGIMRKEAASKDNGANHQSSVMAKAKDRQESGFSFSFL
jgi:hypothetical protein